MVDTLDENLIENNRLRDRAARLTRELDELETSYKEAAGIFKDFALSFCKATNCSLNQTAAEALANLQNALSSSSFDHAQVTEALVTFRTAMFNGPIVQTQGEATSTGYQAGEAAKHVALLILTGLHLNEPEFDRRLEVIIGEVGIHIDQGAVKPALALVEDLLSGYREVMDQRRRMAETAMKEVLAELMRTEDELTEAFQVAANRLSEEGDRHEAKVNASMGHLARQLGASDSLDHLKSSVLDHIRYLRQEIKEKRNCERQLLSNTQEELLNLKETLGATRMRMERMERQSERLSREAYTDPLTKAWNKRAMTRQLDEMLSRAASRPMCLIVLDVDRFKSINDTFGHQAGDLALKAIAAQAQARLRKADSLFRYAGDEFVILLVNTDLEEAKVIGERIRQGVAATKFTYQGMNEQRVTISLGVAQANSGDTPATLFGRADAALLEAKQAGRNLLKIL